jgi:hypothetical protein
MSREGRRGGLVRGECFQNSFRGLSSTAIGRGKEVKSIVCAEQSAESSSCIKSLKFAFGGEFYSVIGDGLVDVSIFWKGSVSFLYSEDNSIGIAPSISIREASDMTTHYFLPIVHV